MNWRVIGIIFKKQLVELLRDKRTVFVIFVLPLLLYPLMVVGFAQLSIFMIGKMGEETFKLAVVNPDDAPRLMADIEADTQFSFPKIAEPDSALQIGDIELIVTVPEDFEAEIGLGKSESLAISFNGAKERSTLALERLRNLINQYKNRIVTERVSVAGLDSAVTRPVFQDIRNVASQEKMGGMVFGRILALILVLMVITGAYYPSIDMVAGEKERGTLETLLVSPAGRMEIVLGKYSTVFVLAIVNALLNLASMGLTIGLGLKYMGGPLTENFAFTITPGMLVMILVELIPLAALFSAVFLAISSFAKSYKEAQGYLTPVFIIAELPAMAALLPGFELSQGAAVVPVLNVALLFKAVMIGEVAPLLVLTVWLSTAFYAALALKWAASIISNEEILLSETKESPISRIFERAKPGVKAEAGSFDSILLFAVSIALLWFIGAALQKNDLFSGLAITEILLIAAPAYLLAKRLKLNLRKTFRLKPVNPAGIALMLPLMVSAFVLITQLQVILVKVVGLPAYYIESMESAMSQFTETGPILGFAIIAVLPALCEEFLFRGYILSGLTRKWGAVGGIISTGFLFGAFHLDPYRFAAASMLGILFGAIVWRRGSIFYGIAGHLINNGAAFLVLIFADSPWLASFSDTEFAPLWITVPALFIFSICFRFLWTLPRAKGRTGGVFDG